MSYSATIAKSKRQERKAIEAKLHPCPKVRGVDILHEHRGQVIEFSAWRGDDRINSKSFQVSRNEVMFHAGGNFYRTIRNDMRWLLSASEHSNSPKV